MNIRPAVGIGLLLWLGSSLTLLAEEPAFPPELVKWMPVAANPVFTARQGDAWDTRIRERGFILREGDKYRMWYTGYDGTKTGLRMLGHATSDDGIHWKRSPGKPLDTEHWIEDMQVWPEEGGGYYMVAEGRDDIAHALRSDDGLKWDRIGPLDIRLTSGEPIPPGPRGTPTLWHENETWYLFYERGDQGVWLATSDDRKVWTNVQDEPVLAKGPGKYDAYAVAMNQVVKYQGRYYAVYHASDTPDWKEWSTNIATSDDLIHWTKYSQNPIVKQNKSSGILVPHGEQLWLYTMHDQVHAHKPAVEK